MGTACARLMMDCRPRLLAVARRASRTQRARRAPGSLTTQGQPECRLCSSVVLVHNPDCDRRADERVRYMVTCGAACVACDERVRLLKHQKIACRLGDGVPLHWLRLACPRDKRALDTSERDGAPCTCDLRVGAGRESTRSRPARVRADAGPTGHAALAGYVAPCAVTGPIARARARTRVCDRHMCDSARSCGVKSVRVRAHARQHGQCRSERGHITYWNMLGYAAMLRVSAFMLARPSRARGPTARRCLCDEIPCALETTCFRVVARHRPKSSERACSVSAEALTSLLSRISICLTQRGVARTIR